MMDNNLSPSAFNLAIQQTAPYASSLLDGAPSLGTSLASQPVNANSIVFYTPTNKLYEWNTQSHSWKMLVPPVSDGIVNKMLSFHDNTTNANGAFAADYLSNPVVNYLEWQYIYSGSNSIAISTLTPNVFIHGGSGVDAIQVATGKNVLDGGLGSNWLIGGDGQDTFFVDARGGGVTWSTIGGFIANDAATIWGFNPGVSRYWWEDNQGVDGWKGATLRIDINGIGKTDASITFSGLNLDQASRLSLTTGVQQGGSYLNLQNLGV